jgi:hypothetical protein
MEPMEPFKPIKLVKPLKPFKPRSTNHSLPFKLDHSRKE